MDFSTVHNEYLHSAQWIYSVVMASGGVDPIVSTLSGAAEVANKQWISGRGAESNKPNGPAIAATSKQGRATRLHRIHLIWICWLKTFLSKKETQAGGISPHLQSCWIMVWPSSVVENYMEPKICDCLQRSSCTTEWNWFWPCEFLEVILMTGISVNWSRSNWRNEKSLASTAVCSMFCVNAPRN